LVCDQISLVGLRLQDYKSLLYAAVAIYSILVNIETDIYTDSSLASLYEKLSYS